MQAQGQQTCGAVLGARLDTSTTPAPVSWYMLNVMRLSVAMVSSARSTRLSCLERSAGPARQAGGRRAPTTLIGQLAAGHKVGDSARGLVHVPRAVSVTQLARERRLTQAHAGVQVSKHAAQPAPPHPLSALHASALASLHAFAARGRGGGALVDAFRNLVPVELRERRRQVHLQVVHEHLRQATLALGSEVLPRIVYGAVLPQHLAQHRPGVAAQLYARAPGE